jgi:hypothetical protein
MSQPEALADLLKALPSAPERLQEAIAAGLAARREGAEALLDTIAVGKASPRLLQEARVAGQLKNAKRRFRTSPRGSRSCSKAFPRRTPDSAL